MLTWRTLALVLLAAGCAIIAVFSFGDTLREWTREPAKTLLSLLEKPADDPRISYRSEDDVGTRDEQAGLAAEHDKNVERATGLRVSNFAEVGQLSEEASLWRLSRGVGRLVITDPKEGAPANVNICTGTLISETYILTAAHCFFRDPDAGWGRPAKPTKVEFQLGYLYAGQKPSTSGDVVRLAVELQPAELACPAKPCTLIGVTEPYDFAILKLKPREIEKATAAKFGPVKLGDVKIFKDHPFVIFQHPLGNQLMLTERHCVGLRDVEGEAAGLRARNFFQHFCDTLNGSSGAPVFSRDHEVVTGVHVQGQRAFSAAERQNQASANGAVHIRAVAGISRIVGEKIKVDVDPPTAEQNILINAANERGEQAQQLLLDGRTTLAAYLALNGLEKFAGRSDEEFLLERASGATSRLQSALWANRQLFTFQDSSRKFVSASISSDEAQLAMTAADEVVEVKDARTGVSLHSLRHADRVYEVRFSPKGPLMLTVSYRSKFSGAIHIWDSKTGKLVRTLMHNAAIGDAAFNSAGTHIVAKSADPSLDKHSVLVWRTATGQLIAKLDHGTWVQKAILTSRGDRLVTVPNDRTGLVHIWDTATGKKLATLRHKGAANDAVFSPNERVIATAVGDGTARIWDASTFKQLLALRHSGDVVSVAFDNSGRLLVTASSSDRTARVWDVRTGSPVGYPFDHDGDLRSAEFAPDGRKVLTLTSGSSTGYTALLWDANYGPSLIYRPVVVGVITHDDIISDVSFSRSGRKILSTSADGTVRLWDATDGAGALVIPSAGKAAFSSDGRRLVTTISSELFFTLVLKGYQTPLAVIRDPNTGDGSVVLKDLGTISYGGFEAEGVRFSQKNSHVLTISTDGIVRVWNARTGRMLSRFPKVGQVHSAAFSNDEELVVTASSDGNAVVWDVHTGRQRLVLPHSEPVSTASFGENDKVVMTVGKIEFIKGSSLETRHLHFWDPQTGDMLRSPDAGEVTYAAFSPDGSRILSTWGHNLQVWLTGTRQRISSISDSGVIDYASFNRDGSRILTVSNNRRQAGGAVRVWDADTGAQLLTLRHPYTVKSAEFSSDGKFILAVSAQNETPGTVHIWNASTGQSIAVVRGQRGIDSAILSNDGLRMATMSRASGQAQAVRIWPLLPNDRNIRAVAGKQLQCTAPVPLSECALYQLDCDSIVRRLASCNRTSPE